MLRGLVAQFTQAVGRLTEAQAWLLLSVLWARLPVVDEVRWCVRRAELDGVRAVLLTVVEEFVQAPGRTDVPVRVVRDAVVVDLHHTSKADFATGIQRVVREVSRRWSEAADTVVVGWLPDFTAMRLMTPEEVARAFHGGPPVTSTPDVDEICVPWGGTFLLAEVAPEIPRSQRLSCMAQCSMTSFRLIVHDLIPVTAAETCVGLPGPFAQFLTAVRHARTIVAVSEASAEDFRGWLRMLAGTGLTGPDVYSVSLPTEVPDVEPGQVEEARQRLCVGTLPLVLVVGSHEPRKNHLTILHAAELLWREGLKFSLSFIGGNAWDSSPFEAALAASAESGRPVQSIAKASEHLLWGAYRTARFTVFPSLHEGFGLPLAESLSCGTPAVTSDFGAMRETARQGGGALLVDPRNDHAVADAMRRLLTDDSLLTELEQQAALRPARTWDMYARETWEILVGESTP